MKPQDIIFVLILLILFFLRKPKLFEIIGLLCLVLAIQLFAQWVFFTAQRLTMYGAAFILIGAVWELVKMGRSPRLRKKRIQ
jgi:hypothetical protein